MTCSICNHEDRASIENALLNMDPKSDSMNIEAIAKHFNVKVQDLKIHAMMHTPLGVSEEDFANSRESIVSGVRKKEVEMLEQVAQDYLVTLKNVGRRINMMANSGPNTMIFEKGITKAIADLYINTGAEIRQTVKAIADVEEQINGPKNGSAAGMAALVDAIRGSKK